jgi:hypothetical protein
LRRRPYRWLQRSYPRLFRLGYKPLQLPSNSLCGSRARLFILQNDIDWRGEFLLPGAFVAYPTGTDIYESEGGANEGLDRSESTCTILPPQPKAAVCHYIVRFPPRCQSRRWISLVSARSNANKFNCDSHSTYHDCNHHVLQPAHSPPLALHHVPRKRSTRCSSQAISQPAPATPTRRPAMPVPHFLHQCLSFPVLVPRTPQSGLGHGFLTLHHKRSPHPIRQPRYHRRSPRHP